MSTDALVVRGLTRRYGARAAVDNLDLTVKQGDVYGFLGPNGAGKTTAMRCMLGLIRRHAGTVYIFGKDDLVAAHADIGAIIETPRFHGWLSGRENLRLAADYANVPLGNVNGEIDRVLDRVGLTERGKDKAGTYSLGMKQRLGIARALLAKPKLMFLDEPTNGLDPRGMVELRDFIKSLALNDGITVFISSHMLGEVEALCNRVGIIQDGKLRAEGVVSELLEADSQVVEVHTPDLETLELLCRQMPGVEPLTRVGDRLRVALSDKTTPEFNAELVKRGVPVHALVPMARKLEELFLEVTT